jgi:predicted nucleotidyltransferase
MKDTIIEKLKEIEVSEKVRILYAVESGSRAWGFESPDSDYDVRFIYVRPLEEYLRLDAHKDVIEYELNDVFDINGWDIRKALTLAYKSNPTLFEWINSPAVYYTTEIFEMNKDLLRAYFQKKHTLYHYASIAKKHWLTVQDGEHIRLKKYFYAIRPILAFRWIAERDSLPPVALSELADAQLEPELQPELTKLIEWKSSLNEADMQPRLPVWEQWIRENLAAIETTMSGVADDAPHTWNALNMFLLECIYEYR